MIADLAHVTLRNGETMAVKLVTPPAAEYEQKLVHFLEHKGDQSLRDIRQRLRGDYAGMCVDKYFVGEIGGRPAGQLWYGYPIEGAGIANFGHVYTEPEHRRKGVTDQLMGWFKKDFLRSPVKAAFCGTGTPWVAGIYVQYGFEPVLPGRDCGPLVLFNTGVAHSFPDFEQAYYAPNREVRIVPGTLAHRHDIDKLLANAFLLRARTPQRVAMAAAVTSYRQACFLAEDGKGLMTVALADRSVLGWAFLLNTGSSAEERARVLDVDMHPNYDTSAVQLIRETLQLARTIPSGPAYAYCAGSDTAKLDTLLAAQFAPIARLPAYFAHDSTNRADLVVLRSDACL